jgi:hypothetical protein
MTPSEAIEEAREALRSAAERFKFLADAIQYDGHGGLEKVAMSYSESASRALAALSGAAVSGVTEEERAEGLARLKAYRGAQGFGEHEALARWLVLHAEALLSPTLRAQIVPEGWRTMESAPSEDYVRVLLWEDAAPEGHQIGVFYRMGGNWRGTDWEGSPPLSPTHWQLLPPPPTNQETET